MAVNPAASLSVEQPNGRPLAITVASLAASSANDGNSVTLIGPLCSSRITIGQLKSGSFPAGAMVPQLPMGGLEDNLLLLASDVQAALAPAYTGPLDIVSGAVVAYGQRALSAAQRGSPLYTIRRSSDNATHSYNSDATTGAAPASAISTFIGAGNGFVATWNDQSGNGSDAVQATTANQPQWLSGQLGAFPGITFDVGGNAAVSLGTVGNVDFGAAGMTVFAVAYCPAPGGGSPPNTLFGQGFETLDGGSSCQLVAATSNSELNVESEDAAHQMTSQGLSPADAGVVLFEVVNDNSSTSDVLYNGVSASGQSSSFGFTTLDYPLAIGNDDVANPGDNGGLILELLIYNLALSSAHRTSIRQNIATYYGITL
jgi:hypothetical protein